MKWQRYISVWNGSNLHYALFTSLGRKIWAKKKELHNPPPHNHHHYNRSSTQKCNASRQQKKITRSNIHQITIHSRVASVCKTGNLQHYPLLCVTDIALYLNCNNAAWSLPIRNFTIKHTPLISRVQGMSQLNQE